jgi:hypothetical protein
MDILPLLWNHGTCPSRYAWHAIQRSKDNHCSMSCQLCHHLQFRQRPSEPHPCTGDQPVISKHLINLYRFQTSEVTTLFWKLQLSIILQLRLIRLLSIIVAIVIPDHDSRSVQMFTKGLKAAHWKVMSREVSYSDIGNSIANSCSVITAVHSSFASNVDQIVLKTPP